ncbi:hypothetical protein [Rubricoccus marinus]|uniref:Uncharacterized protein n=1 Tax=Rubricoccus marinus TaxID=716817 RepID=A0A259U2B4_9BACT|nr:hypothetical protein [Rubricoccus marinus]OZC04111.1 hypothetical protein BSZ36_14645 [Rubricoccus marinus]
MLEALRDWFLSLGTEYGVNPWIFGGIYVGAIPLFSLSVAWLVRNARQRRSIVAPALAAGFFFVSAYLYLIIAGENVPAWVYVFVVLLVAGGAWSAVRKVRAQIADATAPEGTPAPPDASGGTLPPEA